MFFVILGVSIIVLLTGIAHILLKLGSRQEMGRTRFGLIINPITISGYGLFVLVTLLSVIVLRFIPLKVLTAFSGLTFVVVLGLSHTILKEPIDREKIIGVLLIALGVIIFNMRF